MSSRWQASHSLKTNLGRHNPPQLALLHVVIAEPNVCICETHASQPGPDSDTEDDHQGTARRDGGLHGRTCKTQQDMCGVIAILPQCYSSWSVPRPVTYLGPQRLAHSQDTSLLAARALSLG